MLEHTSMYFGGVPSICEDDTSLYPDFYSAGLGPYELQDPVWAKMSSLATGVNKKRKKSDTKPQAQINKCNNEKRRREQENIYIEELAELISANFADMSSLSVKPDKCAILQETVNQIRSIKQRESATQSTDPVQQGEVSSSRPTILSNEVFGPLLLEALDGFLFVVNGEGKVEHVTDNVSNYIKFTRDEVLGKSIYNFIHTGDHVRFSASLSPIPLSWANENSGRSRSFNCRLMVKPPEDQEETYELMHISSTQLRDQVAVSDEEGGDAGPCLLYVASRISPREKAVTNIEQFTTKLDTTGKIVDIDVSSVSSAYSQFLTKEHLMGRMLQDLCHQQEVQKLVTHISETLSAGQATSGLYRLRLGQGKSVYVQTKSKHFKTHGNGEDFVMATHSVIGENEPTGPSDPGGGTNNSTGVGGPLMTSIVNGTRTKAPTTSTSRTDTSATSSNNNNLLNTNPMPFFDNDFNLDLFPTSTWTELDSTGWTEPRPDSRQSVTPVSTPTPRPPSAPAYSPAATNVAQSPLASFVTQPSPTVANPSTPANPYGGNFPFSPINEPAFNMEEQKDTKVNVIEEPSLADSARLRNALLKPQNTTSSSSTTTTTDSASDAESRNKNRILKGLLNQQDDDESHRNDNRSSPRAANKGSMAGSGSSSELPKSSACGGGNNMLLQLLNEKSDDHEIEARVGIKNGSELLQQLLKDEEDKKPNTQQSQDDTLLRSLGFTSSPSPPGGDPSRPRKRPSDDRDDNPIKRPNDGSQVSSSGSSTSKLCERNRMLASLLAKQPSNHQPIPPVPASVISATPQEKLPKITDPNLLKNNPNRMFNHQQQQQQQNRVARLPGRPPNTSYLNQILTPTDNMQRNQNRQLNPVSTSTAYTSPATSSTDGNSMWEVQNSDSQQLSEILDAVIDIVPDGSNTELLHILEMIETSEANTTTYAQPLTEKMAINIIQRSLMQCETAVKSPSSPTVSIQGAAPAYSTSMTTQNAQSGSFPPPPNYPRSGFTMSRAARPSAAQYMQNAALANSTQILQQQQQRKQLIQQQEQKRRLLQQQQNQHLLIPSNASAAPEISPGLQNIDSLLNNTVAPNVSLQRSSSVPESQLSPNFGQQIGQQNQRLSGQQQPYSPHSQMASPIGQQAGFPQTTVGGNYQQGGARLSPHPPPFTQQLSPRQAYPQGNNQSTNWSQAQNRLSVQQQQNPMLNAQLTGSYVSGPNGRPFPVQRAPQQQQQRGMGSPGAASTRHSPFPADSFPPPASPNSAFNQSQYLRLQRANSAPTATTQLPGGLGSPRPYGREHHPHPSYPSIPPPHHPMMYQHDSSQYCYDQTGLQLTYNGADRGRAAPHLQAGVSGSGATSEYVRQELRAVVGARTGQTQQGTPPGRSTSQMMNQVSPDLEALGMNFDMNTSGASESPKLWGTMGSDMGSMSPQSATSRSSLEEARQGDHKSSLLQKLLSE